MKKLLLALAAIHFTAICGASPLWMRYPAISPDGRSVAFSYKGDIYVVDAAGGTARRLTAESGYNYAPVWSPDSQQIAYAGDRYGNFDIFLIPAAGGQPVRLTTHSAAEEPYAFSPDGGQVYYGAHIWDPAPSALFPTGSMAELYAVPVKGGRPVQVLATPAEAISFAPDGKSFLYQDRKGGENIWRKHHTSSITRDIWLYDASTGRHTNLTVRDGEDRNPRYSKDGKTVYMLSERGGTFNVWSFPADDPAAAKQVTDFKTHPVRFLSVADNGTLCYGYNGQIYTQAAGSRPQQLKVEVVSTDPTDKITRIGIGGGYNATVSPDGKQVAFVSRGDIFVTSVDYTTTKQITSTPQSEADPDFAPDNRSMVYASERDGYWRIYTAKIARDDDPNFPNATLIDEEPLFKDDGIERTCPKYSPDGKRVAFFEDRTRLMVKDLASGKVHQVTDGSCQYSTDGGIDYSWSPDGRWFVLSYIGNRHDPYSDVGLVSADGGQITNLTNTGYFDSSPQWVLDGNAILFESDRYGMRSHASWGSLGDVMMIFLNRKSYEIYNMSKEEYEIYQDAEKRAEEEKKKAEAENKAKDSEKKDDGKDKKAEADKGPEPIVVELDGIEERTVRLTPASSSLSGFTVDKKGETLYYLCSYEGGYDLWKLDLRDRGSNSIMRKGSGGGSLVWDAKKENMFLLGGRMLRFKGGNGSGDNISASSEMLLDTRAEREYMFDRIYRQEKRRFYTEDMHGVDWEALRDNYRQFLPDIDNNYDFAEMASEWLGELNVSHTGCRYSRPSDASGDVTADLGLIFDLKHEGDGLLISEVVAQGPFDRASSKVAAGDIVEKIDGQAIAAGEDYFPLLNRRAGRRTLVSIYRPSDGSRWDETVEPISQSRLSQLLYKRWVKQRAADVERLSGGRLGYVHIQSMGDESFRTVYAEILGRYNHCDGIVIDTRFNGGGRLHEDVEVLFSGEKYLTQVIRGKEACDMPSRRWNKPSIMITCEANYSNAHGTPWVYQHMGIGKVVGMPVPGTMTSVSWERLQDQSLVFGIPIIGYRLEDGSYLENKQLEPDIKVANSPETVVEGRDEQLETAVTELLRQIDQQKDKK